MVKAQGQTRYTENLKIATAGLWIDIFTLFGKWTDIGLMTSDKAVLSQGNRAIPL